jgi:hypothetical protein
LLSGFPPQNKHGKEKTMMKRRERFQQHLLSSAPRILALLDKNPLSSSFGSFDRKYWQYKILDFPCGMQQELVLPLAWLWRESFPGNRYAGLPRVQSFIEGAFAFHAACSHADGSLDDYFPHERAFGATAYALAALTDAALLTGLDCSGFIASCERSGLFLSRYREAGTLSNHFAIAALALEHLHQLTGDTTWKSRSQELIHELGQRQNPEGWFQEYAGCDIGYQTVTVEFLARRHRLSPTPESEQMLKKLLVFLAQFAHPDGSLGGEYGSRNTFNFYPGGFAILAEQFPEARFLLEQYFLGLQRGTGNHLEDDGVFGHLLSSQVTALRCGGAVMDESESTVQSRSQEPDGVQIFPNCGLFTGRTGQLSIFGSLEKGGILKIFEEDRLVHSDTGFAGQLQDGRLFHQTAPGCSRGQYEDNHLIIRGQFQLFSQKRLTRAYTIGLRLGSLVLGWFSRYSNLVRAAMQRVIIFNRAGVKLGFTRTIWLKGGRITLEDEIESQEQTELVRLYRTPDCVNMHVVTSDSFQEGNIFPWEPISLLPGQRSVKLTKTFGEQQP